MVPIPGYSTNKSIGVDFTTLLIIFLSQDYTQIPSLLELSNHIPHNHSKLMNWKVACIYQRITYQAINMKRGSHKGRVYLPFSANNQLIKNFMVRNSIKWLHVALITSYSTNQDNFRFFFNNHNKMNLFCTPTLKQCCLQQ